VFLRKLCPLCGNCFFAIQGYYKRGREESHSPEAQTPAKKKQKDSIEKAIRSFCNQQGALFSKVAKIEEQLSRRLRAMEEDFCRKEDPMPKLDALRHDVVERQEEDIPGITRELEEVNAKIKAEEERAKEELQVCLDEKIKIAVMKICSKSWKSLQEKPIQQKLESLSQD